MRPRIKAGDGDPRHGTVNGYGNLDCRCADCAAAHAANHHAYMLAHPEQQAKHRIRSRTLRAAQRAQRSGAL